MDFQLFAPHVARVALVGSWLRRPLPMRRDAQGTWRVACHIPDGRHTYRFRLPSRSPFLGGRTIDVTDPFAREIVESAADGGALEVVGGVDITAAYTWRHDGVPLPADDGLVIYELHIGEFGWTGDVPGTFATVIDRLDYLRSLGVTAIECMPITAFPFSGSWGYNVRHACAVETSYGAPAEFKRLIDECHARGIRVLMDIVFNHAEQEAPLTQVDFHYWFRDARPGEESYGAKFDYERIDPTILEEGAPVMPARRYGLEVARYWVREFHIDGFRLDATALLDNYDFLFAVRRECLRVAAGKPFYLVAEHIPEDPSVAGPDAPADGAWHRRFAMAIIEALVSNGDRSDELRDALQPANDGYVHPALVVNYVESHDEFTMMERFSDAGITGDAAFRRAKLAATLLFTAVGNPMLYQGQEFGGSRTRDLEIRPLQWSLLDADFGLHLKSHYAWLAATRAAWPALRSAELAIVAHDDGLLVYHRRLGAQEVLVVANLRDAERDVELPCHDGHWRELGFGYDITATGGTLRDHLPASHAKLYARG